MLDRKIDSNILIRLILLFFILFFCIFVDNAVFSLLYLFFLLLLFGIDGLKIRDSLKFLLKIYYINIPLLITIVLLTLDIKIFINFQIIFVYLFFIYNNLSRSRLRDELKKIFNFVKEFKIDVNKFSTLITNILYFIPEYTEELFKAKKVLYSKNHGFLLKKYSVAYKQYKKKIKSKEKMKEFMLYDKIKKYKINKFKIYKKDIKYIILVIISLIVLYNEEVLYYEILTKFIVRWQFLSWL